MIVYPRVKRCMTYPNVSFAICYQASCWASTTYGRCLWCLLAHPQRIPQRPVVAVILRWRFRWYQVIWCQISLENVDLGWFREMQILVPFIPWCQQILEAPAVSGTSKNRSLLVGSHWLIPWRLTRPTSTFTDIATWPCHGWVGI